MEVGQDGVAIITLANPPVNALHPKGTLTFVHDWLEGNQCSAVHCTLQSERSQDQSMLDILIDGVQHTTDGAVQCCPPSSTTQGRHTTDLMSRQLSSLVREAGSQLALTYSSSSHSLGEVA